MDFSRKRSKILNPPGDICVRDLNNDDSLRRFGPKQRKRADFTVSMVESGQSTISHGQTWPIESIELWKKCWNLHSTQAMSQKMGKLKNVLHKKTWKDSRDSRILTNFVEEENAAVGLRFWLEMDSKMASIYSTTWNGSDLSSAKSHSMYEELRPRSPIHQITLQKKVP